MVKKKIKNIVIIGSNSFSAGSMINYLLSKGFKVFGLSRSKLNKNSFLRFNNKNKNFKFLRYDINHHQNKIIKLIKLKKPSLFLTMLVKVWLMKAGNIQWIGFIQIHLT